MKTSFHTTHHYSLWKRRRIATIECTLLSENAQSEFLSTFFKAALNCVFTKNVLLNTKVKNIKGRAPTVATKLSAEEYPRSKDEILYVSGLFAEDDETEEKPEVIPFFIQVLSSFANFPSGMSIEHILEIRKSDTLPEWLTPYGVLAWNDVKLRNLRFGLDYFRPVFSGLGYSPTIVEQLYFESIDNKAEIYYHSVNLKSYTVAKDILHQFFLDIDNELDTRLAEEFLEKTYSS